MIIAVYLVLVFPANICAALYHIPAPSQSYTPPFAPLAALVVPASSYLVGAVGIVRTGRGQSAP
ncbi:hypothetical protein [Paenibacillus sp. HGF7]|uniref:hypothetical protein n=1 Tax=Paenibacillus sp. HGF7 TaxID=944559 RepID=UPI00020D7D82|nr:hypothetical protein [Paenibacillus sp. HGF7]EGL17891.1 hypothetical protein HMPREF9413_4296 [Paenibacillus sp. HGF7]MBV6715313.1 hypothetical protein [Paenibacillus chitinolyticus]